MVFIRKRRKGNDLGIARNRSGFLWLFEEKPTKDSVGFINEGHSMRINRGLYPEVTFENSPMEVELVIKK